MENGATWNFLLGVMDGLEAVGSVLRGMEGLDEFVLLNVVKARERSMSMCPYLISLSD